MEHAFHIDGNKYYIYGDSVYLLRYWKKTPYIAAFGEPEQLLFKTEKLALRVLVEEKYRDWKQLWCSQDFERNLAIQDFVRNLKVRQAPIGLLHKGATIRLKFYTCFYRSGHTIERFGIPPSTLCDDIQNE